MPPIRRPRSRSPSDASSHHSYVTPAAGVEEELGPPRQRARSTLPGAGAEIAPGLTRARGPAASDRVRALALRVAAAQAEHDDLAAELLALQPPPPPPPPTTAAEAALGSLEA